MSSTIILNNHFWMPYNSRRRGVPSKSPKGMSVSWFLSSCLWGRGRQIEGGEEEEEMLKLVKDTWSHELRYCKGRNVRREFNFVDFVYNWKSAKLNAIPKFLLGPVASPSERSGVSWSGYPESSKLNSHRKVLYRKVRNFLLSQYNRTCPCDHLTKATTWKLRTRIFSPFNSRIQMYGVLSWKCDHLRNANCGQQKSAQSVDSTCEKRPHASNWAKNTFHPPTFRTQALQTSDIRVCKLLLAWPLPITPPRTRGNCRWLMSMARAGACVQLHIEIFWTEPGKWDHPRNRTTYSLSLRWS